MALNICIIDDETGLVYEWNGSKSVNIFNVIDYSRRTMFGGPQRNVTDRFGFEMWTMSEDTVAEFVDSVERHVAGDEGM